MKHNETIESRIIDSRVRRVRFFEDRAQVDRIAKLSLPRGLSVVEISGVSPSLHARSLEVRSAGNASVLSSRVRHRVHREGQADRETIDRLRAEYEEAERAAQHAQSAVETASRRLQRTNGLRDDFFDAVARVPDSGDEPNVWRSTHARLSEAGHEVTREVSDREWTAKQAQLRMHLARQHLNEAERTEPKLQALVVVQLETDADADVELSISYRVPCALWRPEHRAQLTPAGEGHQIEIVTHAVAWQSTGEDWSDIEAEFSTARPAQTAKAPLLSDDVVRARKKTEEEKQNIVVEARDQSIEVAGVEGSTRKGASMPGVDDGGEPRHYQPASRVSIPSTGEAQRVEIGRFVVPCQASLIAIPEQSDTAHWRAKATLARAEPLLAGPVQLVRHASFVGLARLDFVGAGEAFELGFGPDEAVRIRRTQTQERDRVPVLGTQIIKRKDEVFLSNLSAERKSIELLQRIPVSEHEKIQIKTDVLGRGKLDNVDGHVKEQMTLEPREHRKVVLSYEIRADSKIRLPF